jgi:membrane protein DedA with SNARE-associated domain
MGALFWLSTFLSIGYFFGPWWLKVFEAIEIKLDTTTVLLIGTGVGLYFLYYFKKSKP